MTTFSTVLGQLNGGLTHNQLNDSLQEVVRAVTETRKGGEITVKLKIVPNGHGGVTITDDIKAKVPELPRGASMFFTDEHGNLLRRDPNQREMFTDVTDPETGEITKHRAS